MHLNSMNFVFLMISFFYCLNQFLSSAGKATSNSKLFKDSTPDYLDYLLDTKKFKEFVQILQIPDTDLVNPSQLKSTETLQDYYNGLKLGDILLRHGQILNPDQELDFNGNIKLSINIWENGTVPYYISKEFSDNQANYIKEKIKYNNQELGPNVNFRSYQEGDNDYVMFFKGGSGCYTNLGKVGGPQVISVSEYCFVDGLITHKLGHVLGLAHEQNRFDRDEYIELKPENIPQISKPQYVKYTSESLVNTGPYDYYSIMTYPAQTPGFNIKAFTSKQDGIDESRIGTGKHLSPTDIQRVKALYS